MSRKDDNNIRSTLADNDLVEVQIPHCEQPRHQSEVVSSF